MHCMDCMILYTDSAGCPPLVKERKARERAGEPMTAIARDGYYIPIVPVEEDRQRLNAQKLLSIKPDPRWPSKRAHPSVENLHGVRRLLGEVVEHLWPFSREGWQASHVVVALGVAAALGATLVWLLAAGGSASPMLVIGVWFGWSVFEVLVRFKSKPYVKDGPWWGSVWRQATVMDMISYVGFKNLLIGAALFWLLAFTGLWTLA